jgi:hypothetical protein
MLITAKLPETGRFGHPKTITPAERSGSEAESGAERFGPDQTSDLQAPNNPLKRTS